MLHTQEYGPGSTPKSKCRAERGGVTSWYWCAGLIFFVVDHAVYEMNGVRRVPHFRTPNGHRAAAAAPPRKGKHTRLSIMGRRSKCMLSRLELGVPNGVHGAQNDSSKRNSTGLVAATVSTASHTVRDGKAHASCGARCDGVCK